MDILLENGPCIKEIASRLLLYRLPGGKNEPSQVPTWTHFGHKVSPKWTICWKRDGAKSKCRLGVEFGCRDKLLDKLLEFRSAELEIRCGRFCGDCNSTAYAYEFVVEFSGVVGCERA